jgi:hypothetical protein
MDQELTGKTKSPNIEEIFIKELLTGYEELQGSFQNGTHIIDDKTGWRDDMKFLFHLTRAFDSSMKMTHTHSLNFKKFRTSAMPDGILMQSLLCLHFSHATCI